MLWDFMKVLGLLKVKIMKIFLDDIRNPPDSNWLVVRSVEEFKERVLFAPIPITYLSFDHDLGLQDPFDLTSEELAPTGMDAAKWFVDACLDNEELANNLQSIHVHSSNPPGVKNITAQNHAATRR